MSEFFQIRRNRHKRTIRKPHQDIQIKFLKNNLKRLELNIHERTNLHSQSQQDKVVVCLVVSLIEV